MQEDGERERVGGRKLVQRTENVLRGRERNRGQIRALWCILEDRRDKRVESWEECSIRCGVDSMCATAIVWRSKVSGRLVGAEKNGGKLRGRERNRGQIRAL